MPRTPRRLSPRRVARRLAPAGRAVLLVAGLALTLPGCDGTAVWGDPQQRAQSKTPGLGREPFEIGPASDWQEPGVYLDYAAEHQVALISEHGMLVALLLINPDTGATVTYDRTANLFRDPRDDSTYTTDGLRWGESEGRYSLERCRIRHLGPLDDPDVPLVVDPNKRFAFERQEWSKAASNHLYVEEDGDGE